MVKPHSCLVKNSNLILIFGLLSSAKKSLSFDGLQRASSFSSLDKNLARPSASKTGLSGTLPNKSGPGLRHKYDHVQSKVRKYIDGTCRAASAETEAKDLRKDDGENFYGKSFLLSPGGVIS